MIDRSNTAREWALARTDLLILPVGNSDDSKSSSL